MIPDMKPIIEVYQQRVNDFYEGVVMKAVHKVYVNVDKDRLVKAITDARAFYEEGYRAAINEIRAQQELESKLRVLESSDMFDEDGGEITHCETVTNRNGLNEQLKEFAEDVASQFAYRVKTIDGHAAYSTGGLSTLETAFDILGWDEPHPCPECECEAYGCHEWATCGTPTKDGYKRLCGKHSRVAHEEGEK